MKRVREYLAGASVQGTERWRGAWESVILASIAASLAWLIAHRLLGHPQPFFAPIAAAISLSTSRIQRSRRIVQMVSGVPLGIAIAEVASALLGTGTIAIGAIAFVTLSAAVLSGAGFVGEGMMFANQAAASAILVSLWANAVVGLVRAANAARGPLPAPLSRQIQALAVTLERLATTAQPWPPALRAQARAFASNAAEYAATMPIEPVATTAAILGATAEDLSRLVEGRA